MASTVRVPGGNWRQCILDTIPLQRLALTDVRLNYGLFRAKCGLASLSQPCTHKEDRQPPVFGARRSSASEGPYNANQLAGPLKLFGNQADATTCDRSHSGEENNLIGATRSGMFALLTNELQHAGR